VLLDQAAHAGPVWSLALLPDKSGFVSGSADKSIRFWTWTVVEQQEAQAGAGGSGNYQDNDDNDDQDKGGRSAKRAKRNSSKTGRAQQDDDDDDNAGDGGQVGVMPTVLRHLGFEETRRLDMADDVLCVRVSPDGRLLAASLLDATIKVYYIDR
jgi:U3 small nucleolar RNA-associated protein 12